MTKSKHSKYRAFEKWVGILKFNFGLFSCLLRILNILKNPTRIKQKTATCCSAIFDYKSNIFT